MHIANDAWKGVSHYFTLEERLALHVAVRGETRGAFIVDMRTLDEVTRAKVTFMMMGQPAPVAFPARLASAASHA